MQADERGAANERAPGRRGDESVEVAALRATCRRQAWVIDTLTRVLGNLRRGLSALKAENAELRAVGDPVSDLRRSVVGVGPAHGRGEWAEVRVPLDVRAAGAARIVVAQVLAERVAASVLERAKLVISELVSNSVRHSGRSAGEGLVFRVRLVDGGFWLEVEDPGHDGMVAQHAANPRAGGGFGLHIVQALSERWGIERAAQGGTRVWAQLSDTAPYAGPDFGQRGGATPSRAAPASATGREALPRERERVAGPGSGEVHVVPQPRAATWGVYVDAVTGALSEHTSETEAEFAARAHALKRGAGAIVVHDRYHRTHAGAAARAT